MSDSIKPPRRDAVLKNIPEGDPRREQIAEWLAADGWESCAQQCYSQLGIAVNGRPVSRTMIYEATHFWRQQERFSTLLSRAMDQAKLEAEQSGGMTAAQMEEATDRYYIALAAETAEQTGDLKDYKELRYLRIRDQESKGNAKIAEQKLRQKDAQLAQKDQEIKLAIEKFQFDGAKAALSHLAQLRTIAADRTLNEDQKIEQVRLRLWGATPPEMEDKA